MYIGLDILRPYLPDNSGEEKVKAVREAAPGNVLIFDLVLTSSEKIMAVDALLVSKHLLCGYVAQTKAPVSEIEAYLAKILRDNHYEKVTVKLFSDYDAFYKRVGEIGSQPERAKEEQRPAKDMCRLILTAVV